MNILVIAFFGMSRTDDVKKITFDLVKTTKDAIDITFKLGKTDDGDYCLRFKILSLNEPNAVNPTKIIVD